MIYKTISVGGVWIGL